MKIIVVVILSLVFLSIVGVVITKKIAFGQNCLGYLEQAANANTIETANTQLGKALDYLEANNLTTGYTSVMYKTPDEDISYWYNNLKSAQQELSKVTPETSMLERSNILIKLRETIMEHGDKGNDIVTFPSGLSRYPNNLLWAILGGVAIVALIILFIIGGAELEV